MNRQNAITIVSKMAVVTATMSLGLVTLENQKLQFEKDNTIEFIFLYFNYIHSPIYSF